MMFAGRRTLLALTAILFSMWSAVPSLAMAHQCCSERAAKERCCSSCSCEPVEPACCAKRTPPAPDQGVKYTKRCACQSSAPAAKIEYPQLQSLAPKAREHFILPERALLAPPHAELLSRAPEYLRPHCRAPPASTIAD